MAANVVASAIEVAVLALLAAIARGLSGPRWWALGLAGISLGFVASLLRIAPPVTGLALVAATILFIAGLVSLLVGFSRFAGVPPRPALPIAVLVGCTAVVAVGAAVGSAPFVYGVAGSAGFAAIALANIRMLLRPTLARHRWSSRLLLGIFAVLCLFEVYRAAATLLGGPSPDPFGHSAAAVVNQVVLLALGLLLTFGLVLMSNERLTWENLERQQRLDRAERAEVVARLAGGVAHNFNNALQAMTAYAEIVAGTLPAGDPRLADLKAVQDAGARAAELTRQLLAFGRRGEGQPTRVDVAATIASVEALISGGRPTVTIRVGAPDAVVYVAPDDLREVIVGLVLRAREVTPVDGHVTVETAFEEVAETDRRRPATARHGRFVRLSVGDGGPRIPADRLPHLFEPFYSTGEGGWSPEVGLSSIEGLVVGAGGFMTAVSDEGGSTLSAYLPMVDGAATD